MIDGDQPEDPYAPIAHLYEAEQGDWADDLPLYSDLASTADGPVLDLGCGTGRVAIPLAAAGNEVDGIDASAALLTIANGKARDRRVSLRLRRQDMRRLDGYAEYGLVICALDTFLHLGSSRDQGATLRGALEALRPGGLFAVDIVHPTLDRLAVGDGLVRLQATFAGPNATTVMHLVSWDVDPVEQRIDATHFYDAVAPDGSMRRRSTTMRLRYMHRYEMARALAAAGFEGIELYGSPLREPYQGDSERMVFVARRPEH